MIKLDKAWKKIMEMIRSYQTRKKRIRDLESLSREALRRRLKFETDMWEALGSLGYEGLHRNSLGLDMTIIRRILSRRRVN